MLLKREKKPSVSISLGDTGLSCTKRQRLATVFSNERVQGEALFKHHERDDLCEYRVFLRGTLECGNDDGTRGKLQPRSASQDTTFFRALLYQGPASRVTKCGSMTCARVAFEFCLDDDEADLRSIANEAGVEMKRPFMYPPSIDSQVELRQRSGYFSPQDKCEYKITYTVHAVARRGRDIVIKGQRDFEVIPVQAATLSLMAEDFPEEYTLRTSRNDSSSSDLVRVGVIGQEPSDLNIIWSRDCDQVDAALSDTTINGTLVLTCKCNGQNSKDMLPTACEIESRLVSSTFITPYQKSEGLPTLDSIDHERDASVVHVSEMKRIHRLDLLNWAVTTQGGTEDGRTEVEDFIAHPFSLRFDLDTKHIPAPTFQTPEISRRYALEINFKMDKVCTSPLRLRLPVQVVNTLAPSFVFVHKPASVSTTDSGYS